jgi:hypothetical protein
MLSLRGHPGSWISALVEKISKRVLLFLIHFRMYYNKLGVVGAVVEVVRPLFERDGTISSRKQGISNRGR